MCKAAIMASHSHYVVCLSTIRFRNIQIVACFVFTVVAVLIIQCGGPRPVDLLVSVPASHVVDRGVRAPVGSYQRQS